MSGTAWPGTPVEDQWPGTPVTAAAPRPRPAPQTVSPGERHTADLRRKVAAANRPAPLERPSAVPLAESLPALGIGPSHTERTLALAPEAAARVAKAEIPRQHTIDADGAGNVGTRVLQAGKGIGAGLLRAIAPALPEALAESASDRASSMEGYAQAGIAGDVGLGEIDGLGSLGQFIAQQIPGSIATMAGLVNPLTTGTLGASMIGQIGQTRAENDGRDSAGFGDLAVAAPFAAGSLALDRLGLGEVLAPAGATALRRIGQSTVSEGLTEGVQSGLEYTGGSAGTDTGFDAGEAGLQALGGAIAGAGMGGGMRGTMEGVQALAERSAMNAAEQEENQQAVNAASLEAMSPPPNAETIAPTAAPPAERPGIPPPPEGFVIDAPAPVPEPVAPTAKAPAPAPPKEAPQPVAEPTREPAAAGGDGLGKVEPSSPPEPVKAAPLSEPAPPETAPVAKTEPAAPVRKPSEPIAQPAPESAPVREQAPVIGKTDQSANTVQEIKKKTPGPVVVSKPKTMSDEGEGLTDKPDYRAGRTPRAQLDAGPYDPSVESASFTNRTSNYNGAAETAGIHPDKFTLLPAPRQVAVLKAGVLKKFGVDVSVDKGMQERFAIDQMLDAHQNVQGMAHVLGLPEQAISLGGKLKLKLQKDGKFLGAYQPGAHAITLPKRSNSFAHEWAHALDWHLLGDGDGRGLTGAIRQRGETASAALPANVQEGFADLLNAMFFDKAGHAAEIMRQEARIAQSRSIKVQADAKAKIARLTSGSSQMSGIRSAFYKGAKSLDAKRGGEYWTSPTEMFARAFEAYVSYRAASEGMGTEFIGKGDAAYLSDAEERFAKSFPKDKERAQIFAAFEQVFGHLSDAETLGAGAKAAKPSGSARAITDLDKTPQVAKEHGIIRREITAIRNAVMQAKKEAANRPDDAKGMLQKLGDLNGAMFMSMTGNLRMIQARSKSPALQKLIDLLTKQDGRGDRTVSRTFAEDVHLQSKRAVNRLGNILKANGVDSRTAEQDMLLRDLLIGDREDGPANYVKAAAAIRHLLDNEFYVNQQAGIDLGYTRNGYLARVLDLPKVYHDQPGFTRQAAKVYELVFDKEFGADSADLLAKAAILGDFMKMARSLNLAKTDEVRKLLVQIKKAGDDVPPDLQAKLEEAFAELFDEARPAFAKERAEAWLGKINLVAGQEHNAASPDSKYTKSRELPPEADKLMEQFYLADPVESVTNYLVTSARRTAYARRFGTDGKKRLAMFEAMAAEGVSPSDQRTVERILDTATGRMRSQLPDAVQYGMSVVNAAGTMALLPRAVISSLAEPFTAGLVTGDARSGFKLMGMMIGSALGSPSGKVRFELARAMGIVSDVASDDIMESRYGQTFADATRWDRYTATMFRRTGLTGLTRAQKTHGVGLGHAFLDNLANASQGDGAAAKNATALLRELGVRDPDAFAKELLARGRLPTVEEIDTPYGEDYATAQLRFSGMIVQEPDAMDRPELSQNPVGRVLYGITGFSYGYWRNIVKRNGILLGEMAKRDKGRAVLYSSALFASAAIAYLMGLTISTLREKLLNPARWDDLEAKGTLEPEMAKLAFTRTFAFGAADVFIQSYTGLKYQRDLSGSFVGAGPGFFLGAGQKIAMLTQSNSRKTNTAEYNALQGAYQIASPFIAFGLARLPGGPLVDAATGAGMAYATSPNARDAFATSIVGKKATAKHDTWKPTALDKRLDGAFGPVKKKEAAE